MDLYAMMDRLAATRAMSIGDEDDDGLMGRALQTKLRPWVSFTHQYDFGTTTTLGLRVAGEFGGTAMKGAIKVLAQ